MLVLQNSIIKYFVSNLRVFYYEEYWNDKEYKDMKLAQSEFYLRIFPYILKSNKNSGQ